ncbi:MAG: [Fe-Fe] hydrogenase large subunit C-terminal domain-containing protein [Alphaproteobacteria bacterium]
MSNNLEPIYTVKNNCQDCYKCVRNCPVKAIRIEAGHAMVIPEMCIYCGKCVEVCPTKAKKVRDDLGRLKLLIETNKKIIISLAPSWKSEFKNIDASQIIKALKSFGIFGVSETALGAQEVSAQIAKILPEYKNGIMVSSACPSIVAYIKKYMPQHTNKISQLMSPLLAHSKMLKALYGEDISVVFFGPCIAKKLEADENPDILSLALTFEDLRELLEERNVDLKTIEVDACEHFIPELSEEGGVYPIEGGMIETIRSYLSTDYYMFPVSGTLALRRELEGYEEATNSLCPTTFIEGLACYGGCINGPCTSHCNNGITGRLDILSKAKMKTRESKIDLTKEYSPSALSFMNPDEETIKEALASIGKHSKDDELNCGGCGYNNCRSFAKALIDGRAESEMCVSFMRKQAMKKANAIIKSIPAGIVVINDSMQIIEHNHKFSEMFPPLNMPEGYAAANLEGMHLKAVLPMTDMFKTVLATGEDLKRENFRIDGKLYDITVFTINPNLIIGGIIQDVTRMQMRRDQIAKRASEVIAKNLSTVQNIACTLGEHMAETEMLLRSIAEDFGTNEKSQVQVFNPNKKNTPKD